MRRRASFFQDHVYFLSINCTDRVKYSTVRFTFVQFNSLYLLVQERRNVPSSARAEGKARLHTQRRMPDEPQVLKASAKARCLQHCYVRHRSA
ncbi:hypothetical protein KC347_g134 [Hortaea werneckii]|nr:hypothetical protein KC347_g134 [Hortaea werneckii]